jgi:hypothetical protein
MVSNELVKNSEGFVTNSDITLASIRAYRKEVSILNLTEKISTSER